MTNCNQREEVDVDVRPIDRLLVATTGEAHETVHALIGLLDAARELTAKVDLPEKLAAVRFKKALVEAEVAVLGLDREDSERCWLGEEETNAT